MRQSRTNSSFASNHIKQETKEKKSVLTPVALASLLFLLGPGPQKKAKDEESDFLPGIPFAKFVVIGNNNTTKEAIDTIKNNNQNDILLFADKPNEKVRSLSQKIIKILPDIQVIEYEGGMVRYGKLLITNDEAEEFNSQSLPDYLKIDKLTSRQELDFIKNSKLEVDSNNGVREYRTNLFVAGNICSFYDEDQGRKRVLNKTHQQKSGQVAAFNMINNDFNRIEYKDTSVSTYKIGDRQFNEIGNVQKEFKTVGVWADKDYKNGILYYLNGNKVVGVVLVNCDKLDEAKKVLKSGLEINDPSVLNELIIL